MPYTSDPVFDTPNDDEPMWRNMDFPKFAWLLMGSELGGLIHEYRLAA
jgi:hypothetical protein